MLTNNDLTAIQTMFKTQKEDIIKEVNKSFETIKIKLDESINIVKKELNESIQKNTEDLVELITTGFNSQETNSNRLKSTLDNHEHRITTLEKKTFKAN